MTTTPDVPRADVQALVAAVASALQAQADAPVRFVDQYGARVVAVQDATTAVCDAILAAGWRPPLPDSETEWGRRWPGPNVVQEFGRSREDAENACYPNTQLVRREVGPWIEVQS